jgi:hypothetical protein
MNKKISLLAALAFAVPACGGDIIGVGTGGEVRAIAIGDGGIHGSSVAATDAASSSVLHGIVDAPAAAPTGTVTFVARVSLVSSTGEEIALNASPATRTVRIEGTDQVTVATARVPIGSYTRARVAFTSVTSDVRGLVVGGFPIPGTVYVAVTESAPALIDTPIQIQVERGFTSSLLIDLQAPVWLATTDVGSRTVAATSFTSAIRVRAQ